MLAIAACLLPACDKEKRPFRVGVAIPSYVHAVAWIAAERGYFATAGIDERVQVTGGSAAALRTLIAGQTDAVLAGGDAVIKARAAGADVVVVATFVDRFYHRIVGRPPLARIEQLRGKTIGLPFLGGPQDMAVTFALERHGVRRRDVKVVSLGKELNRMAAIRRGDIDATTSQSPDSQLEALGLRVLADPRASEASFPYLVVAVRQSDLTGRRETVVGLVAALCRAAKYYRDEQSRVESLRIIGEHLRGADTAGVAAERYRTAGPQLLRLPPSPERAVFEAVLGYLDEGPKPSLEGLIDSSIVVELRSGPCKS